MRSERLRRVGPRPVPGRRTEADLLADRVEALTPALLRRRWYPMSYHAIPGVKRRADELLAALAAYDGPERERVALIRTIVDGDTLVFTLPGDLALPDGPHTLAIARGSIRDVQGTPVEGFSSTFVLDTVAPRVIVVTPRSAASRSYTTSGSAHASTIFARTANRTDSPCDHPESCARSAAVNTNSASACSARDIPGP